MAIGVMPTAAATRRMLTASGPSDSRICRATEAICSAVVRLIVILETLIYTAYTIRRIAASPDSGWNLEWAAQFALSRSLLLIFSSFLQRSDSDWSSGLYRTTDLGFLPPAIA